MKKANHSNISYIFSCLLFQDIGSAHGFMIVFSVKDEKSFQEASRIQAYISRTRKQLFPKEERVPMILVATFVDTPPSERKISTQEGKDLAISFECPYIETNGVAPDQKTTCEAFQEIIKEIYLAEKAKQEGTKPLVNFLY